jgi:hypothetical protein
LFHSLCALENSEKFLQGVSLNNANVLLLTQQMFQQYKSFKNIADISEIAVFSSFNFTTIPNGPNPRLFLQNF